MPYAQVRSDARFRKDIGTQHGLKAAQYLSRLPLIALTDEETAKLTKYAKHVFADNRTNKSIGHRLDYDAQGKKRVLLREFIPGLYRFGDTDPAYVTIDYNWKEDDVITDGALVADMFAGGPATPVERLSHIIDPKTQPKDIPFLYACSARLRLPSNRVHESLLEMLGMNYMREPFMNPIYINAVMGEDLTPIYEDKKGADMVDEMFARLIGLVCALYLWVEDNPIYPIATRSVTPVSRKKQNTYEKKPHLDSRLVTIRYMNEMPRQRGESQKKGGTHASPRPHTRRGYRRTLTHEKYRNHPLYRVEGGIYVKPAFVGNENVIVEGTEYRLLHPNAEKKATSL